MYGVKILEDGSLDAFLDYGDNFPLSIACFDDAEKSIPTNLTGKAFTLGIEDVKTGVSICEVTASVADNIILFNIDHSIYGGKAVEGKTYNWDYWEKISRKTKIPLSKITFRTVAHKTEEV